MKRRRTIRYQGVNLSPFLAKSKNIGSGRVWDFTLPWVEDDHVVASNGHIMVRVKIRSQEPATEWLRENHPKMLSSPWPSNPRCRRFPGAPVTRFVTMYDEGKRKVQLLAGTRHFACVYVRIIRKLPAVRWHAFGPNNLPMLYARFAGGEILLMGIAP